MRLPNNIIPAAGRAFVEGAYTTFSKSGNIMNSPYYKAEMSNKTDKEKVMKRTEANDAGSMMVLAYH